MSYMNYLPYTREKILKCVNQHRPIRKYILLDFIRFSDENMSILAERRKAFNNTVNDFEMKLRDGTLED